MHYEVHGRTDPAAPVVLLSSGLGGVAHYWTPQLPALARTFRVITYDQRGTGRSSDSLPQDYAIADMAAEAAALLDELAVETCHFIGHALGGLIGLRLALDRPALIDRLVVVNAWAKTHPHTLRCFAARKSLLLNTGPAAYVAAQPLFLYPAWWMADRTGWLAEQDAAGLAHFPPAHTVLRRIGAIEAFDIEATVPAIAAPTLVIATRDDVLVPSTCSVRLAERLPQGRLELLDHGGHACNITDPAGFDALVGAFLRVE
ncbi:pyrimidine utilization protein D [Rhodopila sp.]|uniref:pyrimidine utilization protein D n=1 Tax=Rhodopila sp. TaxID=2480087 RepID=UPI003D145E60